MTMKQQWLIAAAGVVFLLIVSVGGRAAGRWFLVKKTVARADSQDRIARVPQELDLSLVPVPDDRTCRVGYAEFVLPSTSAIHLESTSDIIVGQSESMNFWLMTPHDPATGDSMMQWSQTLAPKRADSRSREPGAERDRDWTILDSLIQLERTTELPLAETFFMGRRAFSLYIARLTLKGSSTYGSAGVYTYATGTTRGLVLIGRKKGNPERVQVCIESQNGRAAMGIICRVFPKTQEPVLDFLKPVLASFRFTVPRVGTKEEIRALVAGAGIKPRAEPRATKEP